MSERETKRRRLSKVSIGDLRERITLKRQNMATGNVDFGIEFDNDIELWASVNSVNNVGSWPSIFGGSNVKSDASHFFKIRYRTDVLGNDFDKKYYVSHQGRNHYILDISDPENRQQYLYIRTSERGKYNDVDPLTDNPLNRI
jgi:head-tail adaptor